MTSTDLNAEEVPESTLLSNPATQKKAKLSKARRWIRYGFLTWAIVSTLWLMNSFRTQGVSDRVLQNSSVISVKNGAETLEFLPTTASTRPALVFICGSGVTAQAYAPLVRPIADEGHAVFIVKLPYRFAPLESHKQEAVDRVKQVITQHPEIKKWVLAGHSLGGALVCRTVQADPHAVSAIVLIGTTHPKQESLADLDIPVTKVYASSDGVAPLEKVVANKGLLPRHTEWIEIKGGNHSQFGHYGQQLSDGAPTISREAQQEITRTALREALVKVQK